MSASREKKQRQNDPASGLTQKQRQELQEQKAAKRKAVLYTVIGVVIAVLVVILLVWNSGIFQRRATAVSVGGHDYNVTDLEFYYSAAMQDEYSQSYGMTFDPQSDLRTQYVDDAQTQSYHDKFVDSAVDSLVDLAALENAVAASGYTMTAEDQASADEAIQSMKDAAASSGYDYNSYLKAVFGRYMTASAYKKCVERTALVNGYYNAYLESVEISEDEVDAYYQENAGTLDSYSYRIVFVSGEAADTTDADGNTVEATEEEQAAAMEAAKEKADEMAAAVEAARDHEAAFVELAPDYVDETSRENYENDPDYSKITSTGNSLSYAIMYGMNYASWLMEDGRKADDITVTEGTGGYYVVLFLDRFRDETPTVDFRRILLQAELADGSTTPTQEAMDAAKAEAESLLAQWQGGAASAESFGTLAEEHSADTSSNTNGGLYETVVDGRMYTGLNDWLMDSSRAPGDTALIENTQSGQEGWDVVYFQGQNDSVWRLTTVSTLRQEKVNDWLDGLKDGLEAVRGSGVKYA